MNASLKDRIVRLIEEDGPIDVATYMRLCLTDQTSGYYTTRHPIGKHGDFITAPEVSQLFGELLGIWALDIWQKNGSDKPFNLVEVGPGRGTLAADMLRTILKIQPACAEGMTLHLIEISPSLKAQQQRKLENFPVHLVWYDTLDALPDIPFTLVANEFLDALPIHQYQFFNTKWSERAIGLSNDKKLVWGLRPTSFKVPPDLSPRQGDIFETCPAAHQFVNTMISRIEATGSAALFVDYGHLKSTFGDTFQAVGSHQYEDPFLTPGKADLTAHVDFGALQALTNGTKVNSATTTQGDFLLAMGLLERAGQLGASQSIEIQEKMRNDVERLAAPDKMGDLFKVMALTAGSINPHGF